VVDFVTKGLCVFAGHKPNRHRAWHDGLDWRGSCRRCGIALIRDNDGWRLFDAQDQSAERQPHLVTERSSQR